MDPARARELLGVPLAASGEQLRAAYRRHAARHHPDRGGDPERFTLGVEAYELLCRDDRRGDVVFARREGWARRAVHGARGARARASAVVGAASRGIRNRRGEPNPSRVT